MSRWSESTTLKFVELYREHECLWNVTSTKYRNKQARQSALTKIVDEMAIDGFKEADAKQKIKNLRSTYTQELTKIGKSRKTGTGTDEVYVPSLKWFHEMHAFIKNIQVKRPTQSNFENLQETDTQDTQENIQSDIEEVQELDNSADTQKRYTADNTPKSNTEDDTPSTFPKAKRSRINDVTAAVKELRELNQTMNQSGNDDEYEIFGKHVAMQLRKLSTREFLIAQQEIQRTITDCRMRDHEKLNAPASRSFSNSYDSLSEFGGPASVASSSRESENAACQGDLLAEALSRAIDGAYQ